MSATRLRLMQTELASRDFGRYQTVVPVSWELHNAKELSRCAYERYIEVYDSTSVSITYTRRLESEQMLDELEDMMFVPKWAFEREKAGYLDFLNEKEVGVKTLTVERVATRGDIGILLTRVSPSGLYALEFRDWIRHLTPPLAQIVLGVIANDSEAEVRSWRPWFAEKIIANTSVDWDPVKSKGPFVAR